MNTPKYRSVILDDGRVGYNVGGALITLDEQEAIDLTQTGVFKLSCELTRSLAPGPTHEYATHIVTKHVAGVVVRESQSYLVKVR